VALSARLAQVSFVTSSAAEYLGPREPNVIRSDYHLERRSGADSPCAPETRSWLVSVRMLPSEGYCAETSEVTQPCFRCPWKIGGSLAPAA
jgi:hypothetical protein